MGLTGGYLLLKWLLATTITETFPKLVMNIVVVPVTLVTSLVLGIRAVAVAPLLSYRELRRINLPPTLRVID